GRRRSEGCGRLAEVGQTGERLPGQAARATERLRAPATLDVESGALVLLVDRLEHDLDCEPLGGQVPGGAYVRLDVADEEQAGRVGLTEERRLVRADDLPARAGRETAAIGPDGTDARPPVGEVVGL